MVSTDVSEPAAESVEEKVPSPQKTQAPQKPTEPVNHPPEVVYVRLSPSLVYPGTVIRAEVEGRDMDGDFVTFYYEWKRNGETIVGELNDELDTNGFMKGDVITLTVTPFDGKDTGTSRRSLPVIVANRPPEITSIPSVSVTDNRYVYQVKATDPDGDSITFSLEDPPPGMTIDPQTGLIEWELPEEGDSFEIKVMVTDGDATAFQSFELNLTRH